MVLVLKQLSHLNTTTLGLLGPRRHENKPPYHEFLQYKYTSTAFFKKYDNYDSILNPDCNKDRKRKQYCFCRPKRNEYKKPKKLTDMQIRLREERQIMRDLLKKIPIPPKVFDIDYPILKNVEAEPKIVCERAINCELYVEEQPIFKIKTGRDISTQVIESDVVDFNAELNNIAGIITDKLTEQSLLETTHEEELFKIRKNINKIIEEKKSREEDEKNILEQEIEKDKIFKSFIKEQNEKNQNKTDLQTTIAANVTSVNLVKQLLPEVLDDLHEYGLNIIEIEEEIQTEIFKTLTEQVGIELKTRDEEILMNIIQDEIQLRYDKYKNNNFTRSLPKSEQYDSYLDFSIEGSGENNSQDTNTALERTVPSVTLRRQQQQQKGKTVKFKTMY